MVKAAVHWLGEQYIRRILRSSAEAQHARPINERPVELRFLLKCVHDLRPASVLDVGPGESPLPAVLRNCGCHVTAVDNLSDYWGRGSRSLVNRHWHVVNDDIRRPATLRPGFDLISCISVIEHIDDATAAFRSMIDLLAPGGHLVLTCPYNERRYVEDVYQLPGGDLGQPQHYRCASYNRATVDQWMASAPAARIVAQEYWRFWAGEVWCQSDRLAQPQMTSAAEPHQLTCMLIRRIDDGRLD